MLAISPPWFYGRSTLKFHPNPSQHGLCPGRSRPSGRSGSSQKAPRTSASTRPQDTSASYARFNISGPLEAVICPVVIKVFHELNQFTDAIGFDVETISAELSCAVHVDWFAGG